MMVTQMADKIHYNQHAESEHKFDSSKRQSSLRALPNSVRLARAETAFRLKRSGAELGALNAGQQRELNSLIGNSRLGELLESECVYDRFDFNSLPDRGEVNCIMTKQYEPSAFIQPSADAPVNRYIHELSCPADNPGGFDPFATVDMGNT